MSRTVICGERIKKTLSRNKKLRYMASQKSLCLYDVHDLRHFRCHYSQSFMGRLLEVMFKHEY